MPSGSPICIGRSSRHARKGADVWIIFDNTAHGHALGNALALKRRGGAKRSK